MNYLSAYNREEIFDMGEKNPRLMSSMKRHSNKFKEDFASRLKAGHALYSLPHEYHEYSKKLVISTPSYIEKEGFIGDLVDATIAQRLLLLESYKKFSKKNPSTLTVHPSHENISFDAKKVPNWIYGCLYEAKSHPTFKEEQFSSMIYSSLVNTVGPIFYTFFDNGTFYSRQNYVGLNRDKGSNNIFQFVCNYLPDIDQLRAACAFLYGSVRGIEKILFDNFEKYARDEFELAFRNFFPFIFRNLHSELYHIQIGRSYFHRPFYARDNIISFKSFYFKDDLVSLYEKGSKTRFDIFEKGKESTISLTDALKEYISFFEKEIRYISDDTTWEVLNEFAEGKRLFLLDKTGDLISSNISVDNIDKTIKYLTGDKQSSPFLKTFKPQKEFELLTKFNEKSNNKPKRKSEIYSIDSELIDWSNIKLGIKEKEVITTHIINRDYFPFIKELFDERVVPSKFDFSYLINMFKFKRKKKNITEVKGLLKFIDYLETYLVKERHFNFKNYEFLQTYLFVKGHYEETPTRIKNYLEILNKKDDAIPFYFSELVEGFDDFMKKQEVKIPSFNELSEMENKILR